MIIIALLQAIPIFILMKLFVPANVITETTYFVFIFNAFFQTAAFVGLIGAKRKNFIFMSATIGHKEYTGTSARIWGILFFIGFGFGSLIMMNIEKTRELYPFFALQTVINFVVALFFVPNTEERPQYKSRTTT